MNTIKTLLALGLVVVASTALGSPGHPNAIQGAYVAELDLNPLGIPRIEAMALILHKNGTVNFISEHEQNDLGSSGIGVWQRASKQRLSIGILNYRMGVEGVCQLIAVSPPDNCAFKLGAQLKRKSRGKFVGEMYLTVEGPGNLDIPALEIPVALPMTMKPMRLGEFPGAR